MSEKDVLPTGAIKMSVTKFCENGTANVAMLRPDNMFALRCGENGPVVAYVTASRPELTPEEAAREVAAWLAGPREGGQSSESTAT